jgi:hypothetical protein
MNNNESNPTLKQSWFRTLRKLVESLLQQFRREAELLRKSRV